MERSSTDDAKARRRERSARYPGVALSDSLELCAFIDGRGLDGLSAGDIATALGYKNIKTNTFSSRLSAARQFGLLVLKDEGYHLSTLARSLLHPVNPQDLPRLRRQAFAEPPLYADLLERFGGKRVPDPAILGNVLYHDYAIIGSAKQIAAEAFLESARYVGSLGEDHVLRAQGGDSAVAAPTPTPIPTPAVAPASTPRAEAPRAELPVEGGGVRIDLVLWGVDQGKVIRVRAPESMTPESFERLIQALRLHVRIADE